MKLANPNIDSVIETGKGAVPSLIIENQDFFRNLLFDLNSQISGKSGDSVLSDEKGILDIAKYAEITDSFLSFSLNRKTLLNRISAALEKEAMAEGMYIKTVLLLSDIQAYIEELSAGFTADITGDNVTVSSVLKMAGITVREEYDNPLEAILDYMELTGEFERRKLFIFVNMRSYYNDKDMELFLESVLEHEYDVLLVENSERCKLKGEKRIIIDQDLCEIVQQ